MKFFAAVLLCCIVPFAAAGQSTAAAARDRKPVESATARHAPLTSSQAPASAPKIDPAKEAAIRKLFEVQGMSESFQQVITGMSKNMRPMLNSSLPTGEYREKLIELFFQRFQSKLRVEEMIDLAVPIYDKYFSKEEIEGLIQFYQTPLGRKVVSVLPQVVLESQTEGMKWGEKVGRDSMAEVLEEHPDLKKALEEAAASPKKQQ